MNKVQLTHLHYFIFLCIGFFFITSCGEDEPELTAFDQSVIEYFPEITLGFEFGNASEIVRKWARPVTISVLGSPSNALIEELDKIVNELNELMTDGTTVSIVPENTAGNINLFFGSAEEAKRRDQGASNLIDANKGLFFVGWDGSQNLSSADIYVNNDCIEEVFQRHLLREELTQSLGMAMDSRRYPESIFQSTWTSTTEFSEIDKEIIRLLYHPLVTSKMNKIEVVEIITDILRSERM